MRASSRASRVNRISPSLSSTSRICIWCIPIRLTFFADGEIKCAPFPRPRLHPDPPSMPFDDLLTDRQPDPRTRIVALIVQPLKDNKDLIEKLRIDPDPIVRDRKQPVRSLFPCVNPDRR